MLDYGAQYKHPLVQRIARMQGFTADDNAAFLGPALHLIDRRLAVLEDIATEVLWCAPDGHNVRQDLSDRMKLLLERLAAMSDHRPSAEVLSDRLQPAHGR